MDKKQMRASALAERDGLTEKRRMAASGRITEKLTGLSCYREADAVLTYVSFRSEVNTFLLIRRALTEGKAVFAPKVMGRDMEFFRIFSPDDLREGYRGILEPVEAASYFDWIGHLALPRTLVCMPGAAFDRERHRIGYGGGFYDRYLSEMKKKRAGKAIMAALAFDCQIFEEIPWEAHDVCPDCIVTEKEIIVGKEMDYGKHEHQGD